MELAPAQFHGINWGRIDRNLAELYGWSPRDVDDMTLAEIDVAMMDISEKNIQSEEEIFSRLLAPVMIRLGYEEMPARGRAMIRSPKDYLNRRDSE